MKRRTKLVSLFCYVILGVVGLLNVGAASAVNYQTNIDVGFTFNPSLSVSLSGNDLTISELALGSTGVSDEINVAVSTNIVEGYVLSATVGNDNTYNGDSLYNSVDNTKTFTNIATNADLTSLSMGNTWGYSYKDNTAATPAWSNYNGLPLYSATAVTLLDINDASSGSVDFKIAAKVGDSQASGEYNNVINFTVVSKPIPVTLLDAFVASGAEMHNGYFKMQDMTSAICESVDTDGEKGIQLIDIRDNKVYWVAKLKDGNCWMTQNLDLDLSHEVALTSENTNISTDTSLYVESSANGPYALDSGYAINTVNNKTVVSWAPERSTYTSTAAPGADNWAGDTGDNTTSGYYHPYSWNRIDNNGKPVYPDSIVTKAVAGNHAQSGNYYNWSAAVASNYSYAASGSQKNSICPSGWRLPVKDEYSALYNVYETVENNNNAFGLMASPLWFVRSGDVNGSGVLGYSDSSGLYWSSMIYNRTNSYGLNFNDGGVKLANNYNRFYGFSVRCMVGV